jgi:uncharacterized membrane protein (UPF0127 family)
MAARALRLVGASKARLPALALGALLFGGACATDASSEGDGVERVPFSLKGERFRMEVALDDPTRMQGLGGRARIDAQGGMIFVFPQAAPRSFVMRDCPIPIDLAYLDDNGVVVTTHAMAPEEPRRPGETPAEYESRLKTYPSRFPVRYVVEFAGGRLAEMGVAPGDRADFDRSALKQRAR